MISVRRADGREVSLRDPPLAGQLGASETVRAEEVELSVPDGRSVRTLVNATPIPAEGGGVGSVVVTMQDLAPLEALERQRAEFLALVSHELRAPLAAIKGSAATLLEELANVDPAELRAFLRIIDEQAGHMRGLIGDLLDAGSIEAGTLSVAPEPSEMAELVERARRTFLSAGGRHAVLTDLPADLPRAMADRRRIVQVLNNLLSNAARHAPESAPIRVAAAREGVHVAVSVAGEGRGIAPERLPHVFHRHAGLATGGEGAVADTGLGLVICRGLVEAHGGRIRAESAGAARGARFTFTLPAVEDARAAGPAARATPEPGEAVPVLVVDDDPLTLRFVRDALTKAGYAPRVTAEPGELAHLVRTAKPRLVLLDLVLPGADGITLLQSVPELADLPVVFISGYGRDENVARALEAGAADYIVKPFSATELTARVGAALRRVAWPEPFALGPLAIHYEARRVTLDGTEVSLSATEYGLLRALSLAAGRVVTYDALLRQVWDGRETGDVNDVNLVRNFVKRLRAKLGEDASNPTWIVNVRGVGYRMAAPGEPGPGEAAPGEERGLPAGP